MVRWIVSMLVAVTALGVIPASAQEGTPEAEQVPSWIGTSIPADRSALFTVFGLGVPGLPTDTDSGAFTYRVFATSWAGGTVSC